MVEHRTNEEGLLSRISRLEDQWGKTEATKFLEKQFIDSPYIRLLR